MNNKGYTQLTVLFVTVMFLILWPLFFATQLTYWGLVAINNGGLTGVEAFFYSNLNLLVGSVFLLFIMAWVYLSSN